MHIWTQIRGVGGWGWMKKEALVFSEAATNSIYTGNGVDFSFFFCCMVYLVK